MTTIGIIGLGSIGMRHAKNLMTLGHRVIGFDPVVMAAECSVMWPIERIQDLDAVVIATPTSDHAVPLVESLAHGKKCLVEKPLNDSLWRISQIEPNLLKSDVMMGNNVRYHPCVKQAKEWLPQIGPVTSAHFECLQFNDRPAYRRDGVILNWGAHEVDLALYLLGSGKITSTWAHQTDGNDDVAEIRILHYRNAATSDVRLDYITAPQRRSFVLTGSIGQIRCDLERFTASLDTYEGATIESLPGSWDDTYVEEMQEFLRRVNGEASDGIGATGVEGLRCLDLLLEARKLTGLK